MLDYDISTQSLSHKTLLITGAGDGIGREAALTYAACGATVILLGKTVSKLESVYDEIVESGGATPAIIPLDLQGATSTHYEAMAATIEEQFGYLDGILHNASVLGYLSPFEQVGEKLWNEVMQVNVTSLFLMTKPLIKLLKKAPKASVIFTSSSVGKKGRGFWGPYAISKFAVEGMMQTLADEYKDSTIRFNAINPGATKTSMRAKAYPAEDTSQLKTPKEHMPAYVYLMADDSAHVNGESFDLQPK